jgi:hypothetical protein
VNIVRDAIYWARKTLLGIYGPADLDPEHDPIKRLERDHEEEVEADEGTKPADDQPRTP